MAFWKKQCAADMEMCCALSTVGLGVYFLMENGLISQNHANGFMGRCKKIPS